MASNTVAEIEVDIRTNGAKKVEADIKNISDIGMQSAKKIESGFTTTFAKMAAGAFAFKKAFDFAIQAKNAARDAEEIQNKFDVVFESMRDEARKTSESLAKDFGLANSTANKLLGTTGDILVGFGFTEKAALDLSNEVNRLAVDLASFTNFEGGAERASEALTKAILGETESAKALGIVLRQGTNEFKQQVKQIKETQGLTENAARAVALLNEAYKQSGKAVGDFARTQNSLANQERILNEQLKETQEILGAELQTSFLTIIKFIGDFNREMQTSNDTLSVFGAIGKTVTSIIVVIGRLLKTVGTQIGGTAAALAQLFSGNFSAAWEAVKITIEQQLDNVVGIKDDLVNIWSDLDSDVANKINQGNKGATKNAIAGLIKDQGEKGSIDDINKQLDVLNEKISKTTDPKLLTSLIQQSIILEDKLKAIESRIRATREGFKPTAGLGEAPSDQLEDIQIDDSLKEIDKLAKVWSSVENAADAAGQKMASALTDAIFKGENLIDVLGQTLRMFTQIALQSLLTSAIGTVTGGGSGLLGVIGSLFSTQGGGGGSIAGLAGVTAAVNNVNASINDLAVQSLRQNTRPQINQIILDNKVLVQAVTVPTQNTLTNNNVDLSTQ